MLQRELLIFKSSNKKIRNDKKGLKKRLSVVTLLYLDGIGNKKKALLDKYLERKMDSVVDFYFGLLKKKERKKFFLPPLVNEIQLTNPTNKENGSKNNVEDAELNLNLKTDDIDKTSELNLNLNQQENDIKSDIIS